MCVALLLGLAGIHHAGAEDGTLWFSNQAPKLRKIVELSPNVIPDGRNYDCNLYINTNVTDEKTDHPCIFDTPLGAMTDDGRLRVGASQYRPIHGNTYSSRVLPYADGGTLLVTVPAPGRTGLNLGVYRHITKADLEMQITPSGTITYSITKPPEEIVKYPGTNTPLTVSVNNPAFSANGEWGLFDVPQTGLVRVHMADLQVQLFAGPVEPSWYTSAPEVPMAISDDGRFVAAHTWILDNGNISVYDLDTCTDQSIVKQQDRVFCQNRDIWYGGEQTGSPEIKGMLSSQPDMRMPQHIRFVNDTVLTFTVKYGAQDGANYKVARFAAVAPGATEHAIGLLGLGDSYISGQGAFVYRQNTDTYNNQCHLSELSYPFLLGKSYFNSYDSAACSGAVISDVVLKGGNKESLDTYDGQVKDKLPESSRNKQNILATFLPGFIYQQEFASTYLPEAMLLSVGGDDIHFADIIKACVANQGGGTCFDTFEDRQELVNEMDALYPNLVTTYTKLRDASAGARLYVIGYPQIVKADGDCGNNVHLNAQETELSETLIAYLDDIIKQAADTAGVYYVDTQNALVGHRLCEAGSKAVNGVTAGNDGGVTIKGKNIMFIGSETYHPTPLGYQLLSDTIATSTNNLTAAMPSPKPYKQPLYNPGAAILQGVPFTGRTIKTVTKDDHILDQDVVLRGDLQQVTVDGAQVQLQPGSAYQIVLHSDPVLLDEGGVDANGNIAVAVRIPASIPAGYHTLHVYGTNMAGEAVDIQKHLYVLGSLDDYDGNGIPNSESACLYVPDSSTDTDGDSIDDACDAEIGPAVAKVAKATLQTDVASGTPTVTTNATATTTKAQTVYIQAPIDAHGNVLGTQAAPKPVYMAKTGQNYPPIFKLNWIVTFGAVGLIATSYLGIAHIVRRLR